MKRRARQIGFLLMALPVALLGMAAFGQWGFIAVYLGVVFLRQIAVSILDARKARNAR